MKCQCEHIAHGEAPCPNEAEQAVKTPYGTFNLCAACVSAGHLRLEKKPKRFLFERAHLGEDGAICERLDDLTLGLGDILGQYGRETIVNHFGRVAAVGESLTIIRGPSCAKLQTTVKRIQ